MKHLRLYSLITLLSCSLIFWLSCSKSSVDPNVISTNGGTLKSSDGTATIEIPANALSTSTKITIASTDAHPTGNVGKVYDFGPDGTTFSTPITITYKYNDADVTGFPSDLLMAYVDSNNQWVTIPSVVDAVNKNVSGTVNHFTNFGLIMAPPQVVIIRTWDCTIVYDANTSWHADVTFYSDGTTKYDEPANPGIYLSYGTWTFPSANQVQWDLDGVPGGLVFTGTLNTVNHTITNGTIAGYPDTSSWTAVPK